MRLVSTILFIVLSGIAQLYFIAATHAQILNVEQFTIENGLSQTSVNCLIQDSNGFLWVGTQDGLNKFDGYTFSIFKNEVADSTSIIGNFINCIYEDKHGNIWVGSTQGLSKYNPYTNDFVNLTFDPNDINSIRENSVYSIYQDKSGFIWLKTESYLSRLNLKTNKFRHYEHYNDIFNFIPLNAKFFIFEDHKDQLWVGTKDGLNYFDRKLEIFKRYWHDPNDKLSLSNDNVKTIFEDKNHNLWIGTEDGLNLFNWQTEKFTRFKSDYKNPNSISNNIINAIFQDKAGMLWIATDDGLNMFNQKTNSFTVYNKFLYRSELHVAASFTSIIQDKTEIMWVGTLQGLLKIENKKKKFQLYSKSDDNEPYFANNSIGAIFVKEDRVWVGTRGTGLFIFNPEKKTSLRYNTSNKAIENDYIHKIYEDTEGHIWIGTQDGLVVFNEQEEKFFKIERAGVLNIFKNNRVFDILEDSKNNMWVASKFGLHKITQDTVYSYVSNSNDPNALSANLIYDIHEDHNNNLWIATEHGLNRLDILTNTIKVFLKVNNCVDCLSSNEILCIYEDTLSNCLWLGTVAGLNRFDLLTEKVKVYTEKDGLPNNLIYAILSDDHGNLWLSTNRGISKFDPTKQEFSNFGVSDGLQDFEFNHGAAYKSEKGKLYFGGISGYNSFFPDSIRKNQVVPNIKITSVEVLTDKVSRRINIGKNNQIEVPHKNNLITIEFSALDFTNSEKNNYAYKLEGVEDQWISLGNRRYATFSNLPAGKYTFRVKGANSDFVWNENGTALKIVVLTPLWETKFAYFSYFILIAGAIIWFFQYRTRNLRRSNQELKEKELVAQQIALQKEELTIKNKSITDSIIYAKRIQEALMPPMSLFKRILPGSFILHKAKDIVSGDFYWINEKKDKIFIAIVDCTGHGVPGAFMSIIGFELLRNITDDQGIENADEILRDLNKGVATTFGKANDIIRIKDGMDIALCVIDKKNSELEFAGAFRPLYFIRDNKIEEIRGDRFSVGLLSVGASDQITKTRIKLRKNDVFYMFSDGYADQFGGPEGKKYKYRRFRHLLLTIHKLPLEQQYTYLDRSFEDWKGELEQVDDILILGFKPDLE